MSVLPKVGGHSVAGAGASPLGHRFLAPLVDLADLALSAFVEDVLRKLFMPGRPRRCGHR